MKALHARYPFLSGSREAVEEADIDLVGLVREDGPVVSRATERVAGALRDGTVGDDHPTTRVELLSYPVARVLVSLVDERICTRKYARAEAKRAIEQFDDDHAAGNDLKSARNERLTLSALLAEFDLADAIRESSDETAGTSYRVAVDTYLSLVSDLWGDEWRLVNRTLANGEVPIERVELRTLLKEAIAQRVADGLPLAVPDAIADPLESEVAEIRSVLAELDLTREIDTVVPDRFPPCMKALLDSIQKGEHLGHHSRFAITAFLTSIGMDTDEIIDLMDARRVYEANATVFQAAKAMLRSALNL
ncbi:MAG: flagellar basal body rod C-terminal domain-containing protein [Halalkalicoccus sp.]